MCVCVCWGGGVRGGGGGGGTVCSFIRRTFVESVENWAPEKSPKVLGAEVGGGSGGWGEDGAGFKAKDVRVSHPFSYDGHPSV